MHLKCRVLSRFEPFPPMESGNDSMLRGPAPPTDTLERPLYKKSVFVDNSRSIECHAICQISTPLQLNRKYQSLFGKKACAQQKAKFLSTAEDLQVWTSPKVFPIGRFKRLLISYHNMLAETLSSLLRTWHDMKVVFSWNEESQKWLRWKIRQCGHQC